jgi:Flp pilus assembly protein TadG
MRNPQAPYRRAGLWATLRRFGTDERASQVVEFALSMPLLVLFVVGIFDFSSAVSLKQKLTNAAREGARVAASDPANDLNAAVPASVWDANQVVDNYLISEKINDCGLKSVTPTRSGTSLTWVSAANTGCPAPGLTLTVNRGCTSAPPALNNVILIETCVTLSYVYKWQFGSVAGLVGGTFVGPASLTSTATAFNEN